MGGDAARESKTLTRRLSNRDLLPAKTVPGGPDPEAVLKAQKALRKELADTRREMEQKTSLLTRQLANAKAQQTDSFRLAGVKLPRQMPSTAEGRDRLFDALTRLQVTLW